MRAAERREAIWSALCVRRNDTVPNLAAEFGVSARTIYTDISVLSSTRPLETVSGRYGGGVKLADWYQPTRRTLSPEQAALLKKVAPTLQGEELRVLNSILCQFS